jgi:hypothetical protein
MKRRISALGPPVLAASYLFWCAPVFAADPTTADCLAASEASLKSGNEHKLRAERSQLLVCAAASCPADIRKECVRRVDEVNAAIPTITFEAKDGSGADISAVKVTMDSEVLAERLEGTALSIDPGEHTFTFETAGQPAVTRKLVIQEAQKERRELVTFGAATIPPPQEPPTAAQPMETAAPADESSHHLGKQKILGLASAGVGLVGLGVGSVFGILTASAASQQKSDCKSSTDCTDYAQAASHHSAGVTDGTVSTVSFVAGGAFLAAGAVLFFTAKHASGPPTDSAVEVAPSVGPGGGGLIVKGAF